jgi:hypothetical protein
VKHTQHVIVEGEDHNDVLRVITANMEVAPRNTERDRDPTSDLRNGGRRSGATNHHDQCEVQHALFLIDLGRTWNDAKLHRVVMLLGPEGQGSWRWRMQRGWQ